MVSRVSWLKESCFFFFNGTRRWEESLNFPSPEDEDDEQPRRLSQNWHAETRNRSGKCTREKMKIYLVVYSYSSAVVSAIEFLKFQPLGKSFLSSPSRCELVPLLWPTLRLNKSSISGWNHCHSNSHSAAASFILSKARWVFAIVVNKYSTRLCCTGNLLYYIPSNEESLAYTHTTTMPACRHTMPAWAPFLFLWARPTPQSALS